MSFSIKSWVDRAAQFPLRRQLTKLSEGIDGNNNPTYIMDVVRAEGTVSTEGDAFSAANMNNLESRIQSAFNDDATSIANANTKLTHAFQDLGDAHTNWGNTAQRAISAGSYIVYGPNQQFAKATTDIASGETFNAGTGGNVTNLSIGSVLAQLNTGIAGLNTEMAGRPTLQAYAVTNGYRLRFIRDTVEFTFDALTSGSNAGRLFVSIKVSGTTIFNHYIDMH